MPFNLISATIAAPVKILSPGEEEAARAAIVRAGAYENTPSMFDALFRSLPACHQDSPQHAAYVARVEQLEAEGCDTSDAQGIADMEFSRLLTQTKKPTKPTHKMKITIYTSESGTRSENVDQADAASHITAGGSFSTESELLLAFIESDEVPSSIKDGDGEIWALNIQGFEGTEDFYTYELK